MTIDWNLVTKIVLVLATLIASGVAIYINAGGDRQKALTELERVIGLMFAALIAEAQGQMALVTDAQLMAVAGALYNTLASYLPNWAAPIILAEFTKDEFVAFVITEWRLLQTKSAQMAVLVTRVAPAK
jgi:hypothetical protein